METFIIVHGWGGDPTIGWFKWLKNELEKKGYKVFNPKMPAPNFPKIGPWINKLSGIIEKIDDDIVLIGHSIGCQAIMRYLESKDARKANKVLFVAPWFTLTSEVTDEPKEYKIAKPWLETQIDLRKVKSKIVRLASIFSDNDPFVSIKNIDKFKKNLGSNIIIEKNKGHYEEGKTKNIPMLLKLSLEE